MVWLNIVSHGRFSIIGTHLAPNIAELHHRQHDDEEHQHHRLCGGPKPDQSGKTFAVDLMPSASWWLNRPAGRGGVDHQEGVEEGIHQVHYQQEETHQGDKRQQS